MAAVLTVTVPTGMVVARPADPAATDRGIGESPTKPDSRISLKLDPQVQVMLKQTMREHLEAIEMIVSALAREDYKTASVVAHEELGFLKHHQVMQRERGVSFPKRYQDLAMAHHQAAEALADIIPTREMKPILQKLDLTLKACLDCHRAFKL